MLFSAGRACSSLRAVGLAGALLAAWLLSSCGGGGGGGGPGQGINSGTNGDHVFSLSASTVAFTGIQGATPPAAQTVKVTVSRGTLFLVTAQAGAGEFSHVFQSTGPTTGSITVTPYSPLNAGTFTGTINVRACSTENCSGPEISGGFQAIGVTYSVAGAPVLTAQPVSLNFFTTSGVNPADKTLDLSLNTGPAPWTSTVTYLGGTPGWLTLGPASGGVLPQTITASANAAALPVGVHTASISFTSGPHERVVAASLAVTSAGVNFVAPYVATSGVAGDVIIRGAGFNATGLAVDFGGQAATSLTFVSDSEIRARHPALPAGSYPVHVVNAGPALPTRANLVVVTPPAFAAATLARTNNPAGVGNLIYDAERKAVLLMDGDNVRVERYHFNGSGWIVDPPRTVVGSLFDCLNCRIALAPDGTELLATAGGAMLRLDPATLSVLSSVDARPFLGSGGSLNLIAFGNDGGAIGSSYSPLAGITLYRYDMLTRQFAALSLQPDMTNRTVAASADGDTLLLPTSEPVVPSYAKPVFRYDASGGGTLAQTGLNTSGSELVSVNRTGSRIILRLMTGNNSTDQSFRVYDGSLTALGDLPPEVGAFTITPDGAIAYAYYAASGTVRKFNLNAPNGSFGFTEIGGGTPVASPGRSASRMTTSPDGGTLFIAGTDNVIILPAP